MKAGDLRHLVTVEELSSGSTTFGTRGQVVKTWRRKARVRAAIMPLRGREVEVARQLFASATHKITCRYFKGASPRQRIQWNGRTFHVDQVLDMDERNRWLEITASEKL